jgi:glycogen debranching enzyme
VQGLFYEGTRFLSRLELSLYDERPTFLSSTIKEDNAMLAVDLTNPRLTVDGGAPVPPGTLHLLRSAFLWQGRCFTRLVLSNYGMRPLRVTVSYHFNADFADIFEVRGTRRPRKGEMLEPEIKDGRAILAYRGLDGVTRRTAIAAYPEPEKLTGSSATFSALVAPHGEAVGYLTISCETEETRFVPIHFEQGLDEAGRALKRARSRDCHIYTSNEQFNHWVNRSLPDVHMMMTDTPHGPYPYAGVPWFNTPFGRDGIITALEFLWINPEPARGVLTYLAATQATEFAPDADAEPGKILHESRKGEMAALGEIPFGRYYGTVDATPLFLVLAGAYYDRTGDRETIQAIWPNIQRAVVWLETHGDPDGDGFLEYARHSATGLVHQGWKDSSDCVFHADGSPAEGPIALCEVQGYAYEARRSVATLASALGDDSLARRLRADADRLRRRFDEAFWCEALGTYALALDGRKTPCAVRASNAGHCLFSGIASPEHAGPLARTLTGAEFFSGWGIRTLAAGEARYNPMSYHNGSVWPHDNALIAAGMCRYGLKDLMLPIFGGLFDAALFLDLHRLPELFCGFDRRPGEGPSLFPVACSPQAWSVATVFLLLQSCLGLSVRGVEGKVEFVLPVLPGFLEWVQITNLHVGKAKVDFSLERHGEDVVVRVLRREGEIEVSVRK